MRTLFSCDAALELSLPDLPLPSPPVQFYIIKSGEAGVTQGGKEVNRLFKADFFGERALLANEPRGATVTAIQVTDCLALDRNTFTELLGPLDQVGGLSGVLRVTRVHGF